MVHWSRLCGGALIALVLMSAPVSGQPTPADTPPQDVSTAPATTPAKLLPAISPTPPPVLAPQPTVSKKTPEASSAPWPVSTTGRLEFERIDLDRFPLDSLGTKSEQGSWGESRLVAGLQWAALPSIKLVTSVEAFSGRAYGDSTSFGDAVDLHTFDSRRNTEFGTASLFLREAYLDVDVLVGRLRIGRQAVHWGTGILVNDGLGDPDFGRPRRGNIAHRIFFGTKPFALTAPVRWMEDLAFFVAFDAAVRDDNANDQRDDSALGGVVGALVDHRRTKIGLIASYRQQEDRLDPRHPTGTRTQVEAFTTDLYFRHAFSSPRSPQQVILEGEGALTMGHTNRPYLEETFENGADVLALGGLARLVYEHRPAGLLAKFETGFASGDNDGRDDVARRFRFNSDARVGLILFDQVLPLMTARSADRVMDPGLVGKAPSGLRFTVNQGTVTNAWYLYPYVRYAFRDNLELRVGYILAQSVADAADLFQSATHAGYNTTVGGQMPGERGLGQEVDCSLRYTVGLTETFRARVGIEGAIFFPGAAFTGVLEDEVSMVRSTLDIRW